MKTKDEILDMAKKWFAEIADVRIHYPLTMVVRDNSKENTSKDLNDFFTSYGVKNYFSTSCEQWQNGLAESLWDPYLCWGRLQWPNQGSEEGSDSVPPRMG